MTWKEIFSKVSPTKLDKLVALSSLRIETAINDFGAERCAVACSFGKDSMAVLRLALDIDPNINVVWCDTKCEHPETYKFAKKIIAEWNLNITIAKAPQGVNFWSIAKQYGLPAIRGEGKNRVPKCCQILKDNPSNEVYRNLGIKCVMTGITADESHQRFMLMQRNANKAQSLGISKEDSAGFGCGARYYGKTVDRTTLMPIVDWSTSDVWDFHKMRNIPHCGIYDINKGGRLGCTPCTAYRDWRKRMPIESPKTYAKVCRFLNIITLDNYEAESQNITIPDPPKKMESVSVGYWSENGKLDRGGVEH